MEKSPQLPPSEENHANLPQKSDSPHHPRLRSLDLVSPERTIANYLVKRRIHIDNVVRKLRHP